MDLTRAERCDRIDSLEEWARALRQIAHGAIVITLFLCIAGRVVHTWYGLLVYLVIRLVEKLVRLQIRRHTRKLGFTK